MTVPTYRVFLSHSSVDKPFVAELYRRLTRDGVSCFYDIESIGWGDNWVRALERALDECEFVVFILSPDFCNSLWVEAERTSTIADDPAGLKRKVRPLMLRPCRELPTFPRFLRAIQALDVSTSEAFAQNYPRICQQLGGTPRDEEAFSDRTNLPPPGPLPHLHRMPYRSLGAKFIGRVASFWQLHDQLFRDRTTILSGEVVVSGTGGLGKTQLAIEYAHRLGSAYSGGVFWIDAEQGLPTLIAQLSEAANIDLNTKTSQENQLQQLWHGLNRLPGPALLILDNFREDEPLEPYLPIGGRTHTLITTRRQDLDHAAVRLSLMTTEEGLRLLNAGSRDFGNDARELVNRLGGLPLALELAKGYLNYHRTMSIAELLAEMAAVPEIELLKRFAAEYRNHLPTRHDLDIVRTFQLSWDAAPETARQVLRAMGELAPVAVPRSLLRSILDLLTEPDKSDPLNSALDELVRLSLVELDTNRDPIAHRLIIAFAQHRNQADNASHFSQCLIALQQRMKRASLIEDAATMSELTPLVTHVEYLLTRSEIRPGDYELLSSYLGAHYQSLGRYLDAHRSLANALASSEKATESGDSNIAVRQSNLGQVLHDLGKFDEARELLEKALVSNEAKFEPGHHSIRAVQSNLALVLQELGQLDQARALLEKVLESAEKNSESEDLHVGVAQSNLAIVLQKMGQFAQACELLEKVLASDEKRYEQGHPEIAVDQSNLAMILWDLGKLEEACKLQVKALTSLERTYEPGHPFIGVAQSNLALILQDLGELGQARELLEKALASDEKNLPSGHHYIAIKATNLASILEALGDLNQARELREKALQGRP